MKPTYAMMAVCLALTVTSETWAQSSPVSGRGASGNRATAPQTKNATPPSGSPEAEGPRTVRSPEEIPTPVSPDELAPPQFQLPTAPLEPFLITRDVGPFMIMAQTFTGPDAARYAQMLAMELRSDYQIPAYIYYLKAKPGGSNVQAVPPTATPETRTANLTEPARTRAMDEAAVLVGDCKSEDECESLLKQVKKIKPRCIQTMPTYMPWRKKDLHRAIMTVNPLVPAQDLFQHKSDPLVKRMNAGPYSIYNCPGPYTLQITEFGGRSVYNLGDGTFKDDEKLLKTSPLASAADDAMAFAERLAKHPEVQKLGLQPYVFHDRQGSKVTIGAFHAKNDPRLVALSKQFLDITMNMNVDQDKLKDKAKVDQSVVQSRFIKLTKDLTKTDNLSAPVMYKPEVIAVPKP